MKKNNTAAKTALDAEKISKALKEGTEQTLRDIMNEAISKSIMAEAEEDAEDDDENKEDSFDVEDVETEETPDITSDVENDGEDAEPTEDNEEGAENNEEDLNWDEHKVGDDDYDFTSVEGDDILKVYNKLDDDDEIYVTKQDDGTYEVKDDATGAELVIELDPTVLDNAGEEGDGDVEFDVDFGDEENGEQGLEGDDEVLDIDLGGEEGEEGDGDVELDINGNDEDELNEENLGYTDSYQKDVFAKKFNMNEPADKKTTNDWDEGAPKGAEKPWAGKGDMKPFEKKVNECGEMPAPEQDANLEEGGIGHKGKVVARSNAKTQMKDASAKVTRHDSQNGTYNERLEESIKNIIAKAKEIQAENNQYKAYIGRIKNSLYEAAILNVNMGKLVTLLVNESATHEERKRMCERFNNVKTIAEGKALYNTIKGELNESKTSAPSIDKQFVAESKQLNETTIYQNSNNPSLDLMTRMDNLYK